MVRNARGLQRATAPVFTSGPLSPSGEAWDSPCHLHTWDLKMFSGAKLPLQHFSRVPPQEQGPQQKMSQPQTELCGAGPRTNTGAPHALE